MLLAAKTDSLTSWSELVRLDRGTDDEPDPNAAMAANDMDTLSLVRSEQTTASRVRFDLDLPSASADDLPLGPGTKTLNGTGGATGFSPTIAPFNAS